MSFMLHDAAYVIVHDKSRLSASALYPKAQYICFIGAKKKALERVDTFSES